MSNPLSRRAALFFMALLLHSPPSLRGAVVDFIEPSGTNASPDSIVVIAVRPEVDTNSIRLLLDDTPVTPLVETESGVTWVVYQSPQLLRPGTAHDLTLHFTDHGTPPVTNTSSHHFGISDRVTLDTPGVAIPIASIWDVVRAEQRGKPVRPQLLAAFNTGVSNQLVVVFSQPPDSLQAAAMTNYFLGRVAAIRRVRMSSSSPAIVLLETESMVPSRDRFLRVSSRVCATEDRFSADTSIPIEDGLRAWLTFEESDGGKVEDASGNNMAGTLEAGAVLEGNARLGGRCLHLDGAGQFVRWPAGFSDFGSGLTFALWVEPGVEAQRWPRFVELGNGVSKQNILFGQVELTNTLFFNVFHDDSKAGVASAIGAIEAGVWQHFAVTLDAQGGVILYKNGLQIGAGNSQIPQAVQREHNGIGRNFWSSKTFGGRMDDVRVYSRTLSTEEIRALAHLPDLLKSPDR
jgi:hypothetical protein